MTRGNLPYSTRVFLQIVSPGVALHQLTRVWQSAPYFRDPAGIAPRLGLQVPPTYEEEKERKAQEATLARERQEATLARERQEAEKRKAAEEWEKHKRAASMFSQISGVVLGVLLVVIAAPLVYEAAITTHNINENGLGVVIVLVILVIIPTGLYFSSFLVARRTRVEGTGRAAGWAAGLIAGVGLGIISFIADSIGYTSQYGGSVGNRIQDQIVAGIFIVVVFTLGIGLIGWWLGGRAQNQAL